MEKMGKEGKRKIKKIKRKKWLEMRDNLVYIESAYIAGQPGF